jgi:hypothetical protein
MKIVEPIKYQVKEAPKPVSVEYPQHILNNLTSKGS